jgi:hypothetical protein
MKLKALFRMAPPCGELAVFGAEDDHFLSGFGG